MLANNKNNWITFIKYAEKTLEVLKKNRYNLIGEEVKIKK
jgi:hypothetical protein